MSSQLLLAVHRTLAIEFNQETWRLLETFSGSAEEADIMIENTFASLRHWRIAGTTLNIARGQWLLSRVYAAALMGERSLHFALQCHATTQTAAGACDFDLAYSCEALARAYALLGKTSEAKLWKQKTQDAGDAIKNPDDKKQFEQDFKYKSPKQP